MGAKTNPLGVLLMIFLAYVLYSLTVYSEGDPSRKQQLSKDPMALEGKSTYRKYNCVACHQLYGLGGYMGPDLTNVISTKGKGPLYVEAFLRNGSSRMPKFYMSDNEVAQLVAFLTQVDKTGTYPLKREQFDLRWDAWVDIH